MKHAAEACQKLDGKVKFQQEHCYMHDMYRTKYRRHIISTVQSTRLNITSLLDSPSSKCRPAKCRV